MFFFSFEKSVTLIKTDAPSVICMNYVNEYASYYQHTDSFSKVIYQYYNKHPIYKQQNTYLA